MKDSLTIKNYKLLVKIMLILYLFNVTLKLIACFIEDIKMETAPEDVTNAMVNKKIVYVDMDHTLCDFSASYLKSKTTRQGARKLRRTTTLVWVK